MITHVLRLCIGLLRMAIHSPQRPLSNPILLVITREINMALSHAITTVDLRKGLEPLLLPLLQTVRTVEYTCI